MIEKEDICFVSREKEKFILIRFYSRGKYFSLVMPQFNKQILFLE
jgi:hypothetical protein